MQSHQILPCILFTILMSPIRVSPEEKHVKDKDHHNPFNIPVTTQAEIYASLDSQAPSEQGEKTSESKSSSRFGGLQRRLSQWFPHGLLWTPEDDSEVEDANIPESDVVGELLDESILNRSFVVEVESATTAPTTSRPSFLNILQSIQEGDRLLETDFDEVSSSDEFDANGDTLDNHLGLGDTRPRSKNPGYPTELTQIKHRRRRDLGSSESTTDSSTNSDSSDSTTRTSLEDTMCLGVPSGVPHKPGDALSCYTCTSSTVDPDPKCDYRLWKYLRHSEKFNLRGRCGRGSHACMRRVSKRHGLRLTERGCVSTPLLVHSDEGITQATFSSQDPTAPNRNLKELEAEGCYTHSQKNGFLTTVCFCKTNLCNGAAGRAYPQLPRLEPNQSSILSMIALGLALLLYGIAFALFQQQA